MVKVRMKFRRTLAAFFSASERFSDLANASEGNEADRNLWSCHSRK